MTNQDRPSEGGDRMGPPKPDRDLQALSAFIDDELPGNERDAVAERVSGDPASEATVAAYRAQDNALRALFADQSEPQIVRLRPRSRERYLIAAGFMAVGVACGFLLQMLLPALGDKPRFAERADIAYAVYAPEQRHAVEVAASQQDHLVTWLSKRLNRAVTIPSLAEYGFQLVGGRLLPDEEGPAAQFMYQNAAGERLTLYMTTATIRRNDSKIRTLKDGQRTTFYWAWNRVGYALSGQIGEEKLQAIAYDTCKELGGDPKNW
ncbi:MULTISPECIES: anti-sigma factor [unclassified Caballeronia]|jgi:anti-sigma factor RsiW|uniref:anti-sigma factor family protein n=1 Tax=unclassified Caballeronia TaxID=2646786 RepID=UPI0020278E62|nr:MULTISPECIES: anti-sigma factor [unclassified Caballeronia]